MKTQKRIIALVYKDLKLGGVQHKIVEISRFLSKKKNIECFLILTQYEGEFKSKIPPQVKIINLNTNLRNFQVTLLPLKLFLVFKKLKPDIVLAMMDTFGCASAIALNIFPGKTKFFITQNVFASKFIESRYLPDFRKWLIKKFYPSATRIISLSSAISKDLEDNFNIPRERITLCRNWIPKRQLKIRGEKKDIDILYTGRFAPEKNLSLLIEAFSLLLKMIPNSNLCLLGYGGEKKLINDELTQLDIINKVIFPGFTHNVDGYLLRSRIFVMTSINEGAPISMLEAMSAGLPIITTDFPGVREIIVHGKSGFIAEKPELISRYMYRLLTDRQLAKKMGNQAKKTVREKYPHKNFHRFINTIIS